MFRVVLALALTGFLSQTLSAESVEEAVRRADTRRIRATIAGDTERLKDLLSDGLRYAHADGRVQSKADFLAAVSSNRMRYEAYDYEGLQITPVADSVAILTGSARLRVSVDKEPFSFRLRFLAVWWREAGVWRLFAYQSAQIPEPSEN